MANETMRLWELMTNRITPTRAGNLDELDFDLDARLGAPAGDSLAADLATIDGVVDTIDTNLGDPSGDTLATIAAKIGNPGQDLNTMIGYEGATSLADKLTSTRAGYLDELDFGLDERLGEPAGASLAADLATIDGVVDTIDTNVGDPSGDTLTSIAAKLGNPGQDLNTMIGYEGATSLADKLTATRAGYLDELDFGLDERLGTPSGASLAADLATIDGVVDTIDTNVGDPSGDTLTTITAKLGNPANAIGSLLEDGTYGLSALDSELETIRQKSTSPSWDQDTDSLEAIREAVDAITTKGLRYGAEISGSVTPSDGTENILVETDGTGDYAQDFELFLGIDLSVMQAGDTVELKVYKKIDGSNYALADSQTLSDVQTIEAWEMDALWGDEVQDLKVTLAQTAGTYRTFNYRGAVRKPA